MEPTTSIRGARDGLTDAFDIPDPTDWLNTPLAGLVPVEQALRCHVCKDFYNAPMITSCCHTFCSICIRRCLNADGKCPVCRVPNQESKLQGNLALREAVEAFVNARPALLRMARTPLEKPATRTGRSPKRRASGLESPSGSQIKRTRMSARLNKSQPSTEVVDTTNCLNEDIQAVEDSTDEPVDDGLVACPICLARMKAWAVDKHLDNGCPGSPPPQQSHRAPVAAKPPAAMQQPPPSRLPAVNYSLLKDVQLKKKLAELGISTAGSRALLERRHREWLTIWNANCDALRPKRRAELLRDLDTWERTLGGGRASGHAARGGAGIVGPQVWDKDFDGAAWAAEHDDSFRQLIANARKNRPNRNVTASEDDAASTEGPSSSSSGVDENLVGAVDKPASQRMPPVGLVVDLTADESSHGSASLPQKEHVSDGWVESDELDADSGNAGDPRAANQPPTYTPLEARIDGAG